MTEPLTGGRLLAAAVSRAAQPQALLGPIGRGVVSDVSTDETGLTAITVTGIAGLLTDLTIDLEDCSTWLQSEVATLGTGPDGIVGRSILVCFQTSPTDDSIQYTALMTVGS